MSCPSPTDCPCACHTGYQAPCTVPGGCGLPTTTPTTHGRAVRRVDYTALAVDVAALITRGGYLDRLQALVPEQPTHGGGESTRHVKVIGSPAPWNDEAAGLLFDIHAGARRHENHVRVAMGWPPIRRGVGDTSTRDVLTRLPDLIAALAHQADVDTSAGERAAVDLERWPRLARRVLDDDPKADERPHTKAPGGLSCPYCERGLILKHGWQHATTDDDRALWCLRCPSTRDDVTPGGEDLSWPPSAWLAVLTEQSGA